MAPKKSTQAGTSGPAANGAAAGGGAGGAGAGAGAGAAAAKAKTMASGEQWPRTKDSSAVVQRRRGAGLAHTAVPGTPGAGASASSAAAGPPGHPSLYELK